MKSLKNQGIKSLSLAALLIASATFVACSNDDNIIDEQPVQPTQSQEYTMTVSAQKGEDEATTRALSLDGSTLNATWGEDDKVTVYNVTKGAALTGTLKAETAGSASATLKGTLTGTIENGDELWLSFCSGDYTGQTGTLDYIATNCDYATATVTVNSVSGSNVTTTTADFENQQAIIKFTLKKSDGSALPNNPTIFTVSDGTSTVTLTIIPATTYATNGNGVLYVAFPAAGASKTVTLTAIAGSEIYTYEKASVTFTNGQYYGITVKMTLNSTTIPGLLAGEFTINGSGNKVRFSQGNLQYTKSTNTWSFMESQYNMVETNNTPYCSADYGDKDVVSLFGWGTSGWNNISSEPLWTNYLPYATSVLELSEGSYNPYHYGPSYASTDKNLTGSNANGDWGVYNAISNGGNTPGIWRTLTKDEWAYLLNTDGSSGRSDSYRFQKAKVTAPNESTIAGLLIFPDGYTTKVTEDNTELNNPSATYLQSKTYSYADWLELESNGVVFLPAAGIRIGTTVGFANDLGIYWSSTAYNTFDAYNVCFDWSTALNPQNFKSRYDGCSVRLVRQVE